MKTFWVWLSNTKNQTTLAWIGGGIVAAALAYKQIFPKTAPPPITHASQPNNVTIQQNAQSGDEGTSVNAAGNASVVIGK